MRLQLLRALKALPPDHKRRVRAALGFLGHTQTQMAWATGIDQGHLSNALNGTRHLTTEQEAAVAQYLDLPATVLFPPRESEVA